MNDAFVPIKWTAFSAIAVPTSHFPENAKSVPNTASIIRIESDRLFSFVSQQVYLAIGA